MWYISETNYKHYLIQSPNHGFHYYVRGNADMNDTNEIKETAEIIAQILNSGRKTNKIKKLYRPDNELLMFSNKCQLGAASPITKAGNFNDEMKNSEAVFSPERKEAIDYISKKLF